MVLSLAHESKLPGRNHDLRSLRTRLVALAPLPRPRVLGKLLRPQHASQGSFAFEVS
jgi:hypothetical protein